MAPITKGFFRMSASLPQGCSGFRSGRKGGQKIFFLGKHFQMRDSLCRQFHLTFPISPHFYPLIWLCPTVRVMFTGVGCVLFFMEENICLYWGPVLVPGEAPSFPSMLWMTLLSTVGMPEWLFVPLFSILSLSVFFFTFTFPDLSFVFRFVFHPLIQVTGFILSFSPLVFLTPWGFKKTKSYTSWFIICKYYKLWRFRDAHLWSYLCTRADMQCRNCWTAILKLLFAQCSKKLRTYSKHFQIYDRIHFRFKTKRSGFILEREVDITISPQGPLSTVAVLKLLIISHDLLNKFRGVIWRIWPEF